MHFTKETRDSVMREAVETMEQLDAVREALEAETASKLQAVAAAEQKFVKDSKVVEDSLKELREKLDAREKQLAQREAELTRCEGELSSREEELRRREEQAEQLEKDHATREEQLKAREGRVARDEATYAERQAKANASLAEKQKKIQEDADARVKPIRLDLAKDYDEKAKKQEERFKTKRKELQDRIEGLEKEERQMASRLQSAREAQARAEGRVTALEKDLSDLQQQVGPVVNLVEEARSNAAHGRSMTRQCRLMLQGLVQRARAVGDDLRIEVPNFTAGGSGDEAAYTLFFEQFLGKIEETAKDFDGRVVEESRDVAP